MPILRIIVAVLPDRHRETARQLAKWCLVGVVNTAVDFTVYVLLTRFTGFWHGRLVAAAVVSFICGMVSSFILNNFWTFRHDVEGWERRIPKFLVVAFGGMAWNALLLAGLLRLGVYDLIGKLVATVCVTAWNFTMQKAWTFRR